MPSDQQRSYEKLPLSNASHPNNQWAHKEALRVAIGSILAPVSAMLTSQNYNRLTKPRRNDHPTLQGLVQHQGQQAPTPSPHHNHTRLARAHHQH